MKQPKAHCERCGNEDFIDDMRDVIITNSAYDYICYDYVTICKKCHREWAKWFCNVERNV